MSKAIATIKKYFQKTRGLLGSSFYHDPLMLSMLVVYALGLVGLLLLLIFQVPTTISQIPLTYNVIYGVTYASSWFGIYGYLGALIVLGIANFMIAWAYFDKERLLSYLAACVTLILVALMILFTYNLTALVV